MLTSLIHVQYCYDYFIGQISMGLILYSHIPTALVALLFGAYVFLKTKNIQGTTLFVVCASFAGWCFFDLIAWFFFLGPVAVMTAWSLLELFGLIFFAFSYYFLYSFITKKDLPLWQKIVGIIMLIPTSIGTFFGLVLSSYDGNTCTAIENDLYTQIYFVVSGLFIIATVILLIYQYRKSADDKILKKEIILSGGGVLVFLSFFLSSSILVNLSLSDSVTTYVYNYEIYGLFGMPVLLIFLGYLIVKFKSFNIRLIGAQALVVTLFALVGSKLFTETNSSNQSITVVTLLAILIFGYYLVKSVKKEIETRERIEALADELETANERLRVLDQQKSQFVSIASHQLRAPLTAIKGYLSMILEGDYGELTAPMKETVMRVFDSANNLVSIVGDFLDVSRIEQGRMTYDWKDFDLKPLVETVANELRQPAEKKGLEFVLSVDESKMYMLHGDMNKLKQVFTNLVDNSIKYTPKGKVEILLSKPSSDIIRFAVKDNGVGIDKETLPRLFEKFTRAANASEVNVIGTGLGLFVAKEMVKAHNGKVWAESAGKGLGSTFIVELKSL